uniref:Knottin scorpion toxin-like domain-containing protein n=1 Tax=Leersia perrieri TaxID=77586 RepID=A0A0D9WUN2_9ORYZ
MGTIRKSLVSLVWCLLVLLLLIMAVSASSATTNKDLSPSSSAGGGGGTSRTMELGSDGCSIRSKKWDENKMCTKPGTCNVPCRAEGFDYGSCYPVRPSPSPSFIGRFFHVCYCSMNNKC